MKIINPNSFSSDTENVGVVFCEKLLLMICKDLFIYLGNENKIKRKIINKNMRITYQFSIKAVNFMRI